MDTTLFTIRDRGRAFAAEFAVPQHFTLDEGQPASPQRLLNEPGWSPYCLDDANRSVLFVHTPPEVELTQAPFVYTAQFENAQRAMAVPYEALVQVTQGLKPSNTIIFIHSIGRCGSTLMSKILSQIEGVHSLSEPDIYTNLSYLRNADKSREKELIQVLKSFTLLLCRQENAVTAIKPRSHGIALSDWLDEAFPNVRNLFMYRNALTWAQSVSRFLQRLGFQSHAPRDEALFLWRGLTLNDASYLEPYVDMGAERIIFSDVLAPLWISYLELYMAKHEQGVPFLTVRYEDLNERREQTLKAVLTYCGLPTSNLEQAMQTFEADSQAGSAVARDVQANDLTPERIEAFLALLARHPRFNDPDFILPDSSKR